MVICIAPHAISIHCRRFAWSRANLAVMTSLSPFFPRNGPHVEPLDYTFWARPGVPTTTSPGSAALAPASGCQGQAPLSWRMARSGVYGFCTLGVCGTHHPQMAVRDVARRVPPASGFRPGEWSCLPEFRENRRFGSNRKDLVNDEVLTGLLRSSLQQPPRPVIVGALRRSCFVHLVWSTGPTDTLYGDQFRGLAAPNGWGPEPSRMPVFG